MSKLTRTPDIKALSNFTPQPIEWLWRDRIPIGKVSIIAGDPGLGKGLVTIDMAARVTTGTPFPDAPDVPVQEGDVVMLSGEDDIEDTVLPRLLAAGGKSDRVHALKSIVTLDDAYNRVSEELFTLDMVDMLAEALGILTRTPRMVVIDPITAFLGSRTDSNNNSDVRTALMPLQDLAERYRVAVIIVSHLNKAPGKNSLHRVMGSLAWIAAARASYLVVKSDGDPNRILFLPSKTNLGPARLGLSYCIEGVELTPETVPIKTCRVAWGSDLVSITADDALARDGGLVNGDSATEEWVRNRLAAGEPVQSKEMFEVGERDGFTAAEIRRALKGVGAKGGPINFQGPWAWRLPGSAPRED